MTDIAKKSYIKENLSIFASAFIVCLVYFYFSSNWHIPSKLLIKGRSISGSAIRVSWDSGNGFNTLESTIIDAGLPVKQKKKKHTITIRRTGEKNPSSASTLVYIVEMLKDDQRTYIDHFGSKNDVRLILPNLLLIETEGGAFSFDTKIKNYIEVRFLTNSSSGYVDISFDGAMERFDLFSEKEGDKRVLRRLKKCIPGEFSVSASLPRYNIDRIKIDAFEKDGLFKVESAAIVSDGGTINLPLGEKNAVSSLIFTDFERGTKRYFHPVQFTFQVVFASIMAYLVVCAVRFCRSRGGLKATLIGDRRMTFWLMFTGSVLVFSCWLIAYWPGNMTTDSIDIWRVAKIPGAILNDHPFLNVVFYKFLQQIWDHVAIVGIVHILATAALGSYIYYFLYKNGITIWALLPFYLLFVFSIPVGIYNIILWKDVPFAILVLFLAFYLAYLYFSKTKGGVSLSYGGVVILLMSLAALCLIRYNGIINMIAIPTVVLLLGLFPSKKMAIMFFLPLFTATAIAVFMLPFFVKTDFVKRQSDLYIGRLKTMRPVTMAKEVTRKYFSILDIIKHRVNSDTWTKDSISVGWHQNFIKRKGYNDFFRYYNHNPPSERAYRFMEALKRTSFGKPWIYFSWNPFYFLWLFPLSLMLFKFLPMSAIFSAIVLSQVLALLVVVGSVNWRYYYFLLFSSFFLLPLAMLDLKLWKESRTVNDRFGE